MIRHAQRRPENGAKRKFNEAYDPNEPIINCIIRYTNASNCPKINITLSLSLVKSFNGAYIPSERLAYIETKWKNRRRNPLLIKLGIFVDLFANAYHQLQEEQTMNAKQVVLSLMTYRATSITDVDADLKKLSMGASANTTMFAQMV